MPDWESGCIRDMLMRTGIPLPNPSDTRSIEQYVSLLNGELSSIPLIKKAYGSPKSVTHVKGPITAETFYSQQSHGWNPMSRRH